MNSHNAHTHAALYTRISYKDLQLFHLHHSQADTLIISSSPAAPPPLPQASLNFEETKSYSG